MLENFRVRKMPTRPRRGLGVPSIAVVLATAALSLGLGATEAKASGAYLEFGSRTSQPSGAAGLCERYRWACANGVHGQRIDRAALAEISRLNRGINRAVRSVSDERQFGVRDHWSYPASGAGDCEDFALAKKRALVAMGVPANRLLLATVHSRRYGPHAVLVLRLDDGDYVLDNLNDDILPWHATGYSFLKVQSPSQPRVWLSAFRNRS